MIDKEKILKGLECCCAMSGYKCRQCPYSDECIDTAQPYGMAHLAVDALELIQAYQQLLEWAVECGFGYDNIPELYKPQYKDEIEHMSYTGGLLYMAHRSLKQESR